MFRYQFHDEEEATTWWERDPDREFTVQDEASFVDVDGGAFRCVFEFSTLWDHILMGPYPQRREDIDKLAEAGVRVVLNLQTDRELRVRGVNMGALGVDYACVPSSAMECEAEIIRQYLTGGHDVLCLSLLFFLAFFS